MNNIPSNLTPCPITEADCVVNARGEVFDEVYCLPEGLLRVDLKRADEMDNQFDVTALHNACLTPCKPRPVFVEAVSRTKFREISDAALLSECKVAYGEDNDSCFYFNKSDLAGIENIPTENLEIVLRVKVQP